MCSSDRAQRIDVARGLVEKLVAADARHLLPSTWRALLMGEMGVARQGYLLHEFLTEHWRPAFFADVASALAGARCDYVGSATLDENFPGMTLTPDQQALWHAAPEGEARELVKDLCVPRAFRRDVFVRGLRRVHRDLATDGLVLAGATGSTEPRKLSTQAGEATLPPAIIDPMRAALAAGPQSIGALRALPGCGGVTPTEALAMLVGSGAALPLWRQPGADPGWDAAAAAARRLNAVAARRLAPHGMGGTARLALATPALGGGLPVESLELAVAPLMAEMPPGPDGAIDLPALIRRLVPPGPLPPPEVLGGLQETLVTILQDRWAVWRSLGIA